MMRAYYMGNHDASAQPAIANSVIPPRSRPQRRRRQNAGPVAGKRRHWDANGNAGLHGRHIDDGRTVICQYQGAAKEPSPSREKAENLAAAREAARFKWVTAPGRGVKPGEIEAVWHHGHY